MIQRIFAILTSQFQNVPFCPISASGSNFSPRNTQSIPAVNPATSGIAFLDLGTKLNILKLALTLCVFVSLLTHSLVSATEHPSGHKDLFDFGSVSMDSGEIKNTVQRAFLAGEKNRPDLGIPPALITRKLRKRNPGFMISVESVLQKLEKKEEIVLIDVRNREAFEILRIPGSINIPLFAIKTKGFLKSKPLVLIHEGYHHGPLEQSCEHLRDAGFTAVWVLNGGLNAWRQKGGSLSGDIFAQKVLNRMPPQIFFEEKNDENLLVIDVSESESPEARDLIPQAIPIPFSNDAAQFVSKIKRATDRDKRSPLLSVLIFNESGEQYERIEKRMQATGITNVFYLKEGLKGYKAFLQRQALLWQPKNRSTKTVKKCPSCP